MRSSCGTKRRIASRSEDLPAAVLLWMRSANGRSSLREIAARYPTSALLPSPTIPQRLKSLTIRSMRSGALRSSIARDLALSSIEETMGALRCERGRDELLLLGLERQEEFPQITFDDFFRYGELDRRLLHERRSRSSMVEVERIDVHRLTHAIERGSGGHEIHLENLVREVLLEPPHPIAPLRRWLITSSRSCAEGFALRCRDRRRRIRQRLRRQCSGRLRRYAFLLSRFFSD